MNKMGALLLGVYSIIAVWTILFKSVTNKKVKADDLFISLAPTLIFLVNIVWSLV